MLAVILACTGLAVIAGGTDRLLASAVSREVARRAERLLGAGSAPVVRITGAPFLTQFVAGVYREVHVTAPTCVIGSLELHGLAIRLSRVRASLRRLPAASALIAGSVTASATIPFAVLTARLPPGLVLRRSGEDIGISGPARLMPVAGTLAVAADGQQILVVPKVLGVKGLVGFVITLPGLPPELVVHALQVSEAGLEVTVTGDDVILARR